jgi:hypothetical protein
MPLLAVAATAGRVAGNLAFPNRIAITPDGATLIVAECYANRLAAYDVGGDGGLGNRRVSAQTPADHPAGSCMNARGRRLVRRRGNQHCVRVREDGEVLATVDLDRGAFASALSRGEDPHLFAVGQTWIRQRPGVRSSGRSPPTRPAHQRWPRPTTRLPAAPRAARRGPRSRTRSQGRPESTCYLRSSIGPPRAAVAPTSVTCMAATPTLADGRPADQRRLRRRHSRD